MLDEIYPLVLWCYCSDRRALITNVIAKDLFQLRGQTPHFATFGKEGDFSNMCQLGSYEWVYFCETTAEFPSPSHVLGSFICPSKN